MEEPLYDLWASRNDEDPLRPPMRIGGSSSETAVFSLAARRAAANADRVRTAYILLAALGVVGGHHWYLGRPVLALLYLAMTVSGVVAVVSGQGPWWFIPVLLAMAIDAVLLPRYGSRAGGSLFGL